MFSYKSWLKFLSTNEWPYGLRPCENIISGQLSLKRTFVIIEISFVVDLRPTMTISKGSMFFLWQPHYYICIQTNINLIQEMINFFHENLSPGNAGYLVISNYFLRSVSKKKKKLNQKLNPNKCLIKLIDTKFPTFKHKEVFTLPCLQKLFFFFFFFSHLPQYSLSR